MSDALETRRGSQAKPQRSMPDSFFHLWREGRRVGEGEGEGGEGRGGLTSKWVKREGAKRDCGLCVGLGEGLSLWPGTVERCGIEAINPGRLNLIPHFKPKPQTLHPTP